MSDMTNGDTIQSYIFRSKLDDFGVPYANVNKICTQSDYPDGGFWSCSNFEWGSELFFRGISQEEAAAIVCFLDILRNVKGKE